MDQQLVSPPSAVPVRIDHDLDAWVLRLRRNIPTAIKRTSGRRAQPERVKPGLPPGQFLTEHGADLTPRQIDFGKVMDRYKRDFRRPYPTYAQVLDVIDAMGYRLAAPTVAGPGCGACGEAAAPARPVPVHADTAFPDARAWYDNAEPHAREATDGSAATGTGTLTGTDT